MLQGRQEAGVRPAQRSNVVQRRSTRPVCERAHDDDDRRDEQEDRRVDEERGHAHEGARRPQACLLYTSDAADERSSVDLGGRRILNKKKKKKKHVQLSNS